MNFLKKLIVASVLSLVLVPAQIVQAAMPLINPTDALIDNVAEATSIDVGIDIDVETDNDETDQPVKLHIDVDGATDFGSNTVIDAGLWSTDEYGVYQATSGALIASSDTIYVAGNEGQWYSIETSNTIETSVVTDTQADTTELKNVINELFVEGVIEYDLETVEFLNGQLAVRYAYAVDNDKLLDYLVETGTLESAEAEELRATYANQVIINGYFWADTLTMLPVKLTMNVGVYPSATSYTTVAVSIDFNSFNEPVAIVEPTDAIAYFDYVSGESESEIVVVSSVETTIGSMDTDNDGLTNGDEDSVWFSDAFSVDTDGDGYLDKTEVINGYNPNGVGKLDSDLDGLTDYNEMTIHWSDRYNADTDGDGYSDGLEIANGYSPNGPGRW